MMERTLGAPPGSPPQERPGWPEVLRALREARGATLDGWGARIGVSRTTVQRWERGDRAPDPGAEEALIAACRELGLFRPYDRGPLAGLDLTPELLRDVIADARFTAGRQRTGSSAATASTDPAALPIASAVASPATPLPPSALPVQLTSFVGRKRELAAVRRLQADSRLLTLTGAGGAGKTRLALRVAEELVPAYPHGIWFVDLAPLADPALVPQAVASALAVRRTGQQTLTEELIEALRTRHLLLVLDNCEQLLPACAELTEALLRACPHLSVLATSRASLGVPGETVWRVPPMAVPGSEFLVPGRPERNQEPGTRNQELPDAVRLFVERAKLRWPEFVPDTAESAAIAESCRRLDGMPLAIELAAARVSVLSVGQIAARLDDRLGLLTAGGRGTLPRQRTLRATLDWSYDLLAEPERALLQALSVFASGFTLEAAEAVAGGAGGDAVAVLDRLTSLVEQSLVVLGDRAGEPRYRLLETVRAYAREKLMAADSSERGAADWGHAVYFLELAEEAEPKLRGREQVAWFARLEAEHDNLRTALAWAAETGEVTTGLRLGGALWWFWHIRGHYDEGRRWLARFLADAPRQPAAVRAKALQGAASLAGAQVEGDYQTARALLDEALAVTRQSGGTDRQIAVCLSNLGYVTHLLGDTAMGRTLLEEALAIQRQLADPGGLAIALGFLGRLARAEGDTAGARLLQAERLTLCWDVRDVWGTTWALAETAGLVLNDQPDLGARLLGVVAVIGELRGNVPLHERVDRAALTDAARRALGDRAFTTAWAAGRSLPLAQAVVEALAVLTAPAATLPGTTTDRP